MASALGEIEDTPDIGTARENVYIAYGDLADVAIQFRNATTVGSRLYTVLDALQMSAVDASELWRDGDAGGAANDQVATHLKSTLDICGLERRRPRLPRKR